MRLYSELTMLDWSCVGTQVTVSVGPRFPVSLPVADRISVPLLPQTHMLKTSLQSDATWRRTFGKSLGRESFLASSIM